MVFVITFLPYNKNVINWGYEIKFLDKADSSGWMGVGKNERESPPF
jgi:hypothetical protein